MTTTILQGDALAVLRTLSSESVHCVVTSPPYWALRRYGTCRCVRLIKDSTSTIDGAAGGTPNHQKADPHCQLCGGTGHDPTMASEMGSEPTSDCRMQGMMRLKAGLTEEQVQYGLGRLGKLRRGTPR